MDSSSLLQNSCKGGLLFWGAYFVLHSIKRLYQETTPTCSTKVKSQLCTIAMGTVGAAVLCSTFRSL